MPSTGLLACVHVYLLDMDRTWGRGPVGDGRVVRVGTFGPCGNSYLDFVPHAADAKP